MTPDIMHVRVIISLVLIILFLDRIESSCQPILVDRYQLYDAFMGPIGDVQESRASPDSSQVVYIADQDTEDLDELYSVPASGGTSVKISDPLLHAGDVDLFSISPNSTGGGLSGGSGGEQSA
jgi:hypothetical protein